MNSTAVKMLKIWIPVIVVVIHLMFFSFLLGKHQKSRPKEPTPTEVGTTVNNAPSTTEPGLATPAGGDADVSLPVPAPPPPAPKSLVPAITPFSASYFANDIRPLPQQLGTLVQNCKGGIAIDLTSRKIHWEKAGTTAQPIASITKMMTVLEVAEFIDKSQGSLNLETPVKVTAAASKIGGRQVWLDPRETFTINELLKCTLIRSANDCAYLLAEFLGGSEQAFVQVMSSRAKELGCQNFVFHNAHGLPTGNQENMGTPLEIAYLSSILLDVPAITRWSSVRHDTIRENTKPFNLDSTNHLLGTCPGVNGMKTGFTNKAGYCLCATCERNSRRVVVVILGCEKGTIRDNIARQLIDWVYTL